jgi:hypothetical protein
LFFNKQFVTSGFSRRIKAANSSFWRQIGQDTILTVRLKRRVRILLFALSLNIGALRTVAAGDRPQDYVVHKDSESPDSRYGVLVLSQEAGVDKDQTEGNTTGEIRATDYFEGQNHRELGVKDRIRALQDLLWWR